MNELEKKIKKQREMKEKTQKIRKKIETLQESSDLFELHFTDGSMLKSKQIENNVIKYFFKKDTIAEQVSNLINSKEAKYHCFFANKLPDIMPQICTKFIDMVDKNQKKIDSLLKQINNDKKNTLL